MTTMLPTTSTPVSRPASTPPAPRRRLGGARLLSLLALAAHAAAAGAGAVPLLDTAAPTAVRQGDVITLGGSGFHPRPEDHRVFIGGGGAAVWADVLAATSSQLTVEVGPIPGAGVEILTLWTGEGFALPDAVLPAAERTYLLTNASWFVAAEEARYASITLLEATPETQGGRLEDGQLKVVVPTPPPPPPCTPPEEGGVGCFEIDIKVVATTDGEDPLPPPGGSLHALPGALTATPAGLGVAASLSMRLMAAAAAPDPAELAADVAQALQQTFGPLGLAAAAVGSEVVVSYGGGLGGGSAVVARVPLGASGP